LFSLRNQFVKIVIEEDWLKRVENIRAKREKGKENYRQGKAKNERSQYQNREVQTGFDIQLKGDIPCGVWWW
jgi:hypothetical protein